METEEEMKKKYVVAFLATLFFILAIPIITLAQPTADSLGVEDASGRSGTYVEVPVNIVNVTNGPVQSIRLRVDYNENVLNLTNISNSVLTSAWIDLRLGEDRHTMVIATAYTGEAISNGSSGSVMLLNFHVIGSPGDTSPMNMMLIEFSNPEGEVGRTTPARNGTFTVEPSGEQSTTTPTPPGGVGPSGGGGSPTTPTPTPTEKPSAVEKALKIISRIEAGKPESVTFEGLDVYKISIEVDKTVSDVNVMVEEVNKPEEITDAPGIVYSYYNIAATNLTDVNVTATIEFKVKKSWMADENVEEATIRLNRYDEEWVALPPSKINEDNAYVYFPAVTHGFSIFAISGEKKVEVAATPTQTPTPTPTPAPVHRTPPLVLILIVIAVIVIAGITIIVLRRK